MVAVQVQTANRHQRWIAVCSRELVKECIHCWVIHIFSILLYQSLEAARSNTFRSVYALSRIKKLLAKRKNFCQNNIENHLLTPSLLNKRCLEWKVHKSFVFRRQGSVLCDNTDIETPRKLKWKIATSIAFIAHTRKRTNLEKNNRFRKIQTYLGREIVENRKKALSTIVIKQKSKHWKWHN